MQSDAIYSVLKSSFNNELHVISLSSCVWFPHVRFQFLIDKDTQNQHLSPFKIIVSFSMVIYEGGPCHNSLYNIESALSFPIHLACLYPLCASVSLPQLTLSPSCVPSANVDMLHLICSSKSLLQMLLGLHHYFVAAAQSKNELLIPDHYFVSFKQ